MMNYTLPHNPVPTIKANRWPGDCASCGNRVPAQQGILTGSKAEGFTVSHMPGMCEAPKPVAAGEPATPAERPNKFPGTCATCKQPVLAGAGILGKKIKVAGKTRFPVTHKPGECAAALQAPAAVNTLPPLPAKPYVPKVISVTMGVFKFEGDIYVVRPSRKHYQHKRLVAMRLVESAPRMTHAGTVIPFDLREAYSVIYKLTEDMRLTLADANEISAKYSRCMCCARDLYAAETIALCEKTGLWVGPDCRENYFPKAS
jgi:hypothetical protein